MNSKHVYKCLSLDKQKEENLPIDCIDYTNIVCIKDCTDSERESIREALRKSAGDMGIENIGYTLCVEKDFMYFMDYLSCHLNIFVEHIGDGEFDCTLEYPKSKTCFTIK